jgi:putative MATE family efflux protein
VARRIGEGNAREAFAASVHAAVLGAILGVIVGGAGWLGAGPLVAFFDTEPAVTRVAVPFLEITLAAHAFFFVSMALGAAYHGMGDTRTPMIVSTAVVALNAILDPLLIFAPGELVVGGFDVGFLGLGLGVQGAAISDVIATALGCFVFLALWLLDGPFPKAVRGAVRIRPVELWRLLEIGIPASVSMLARPLSTFFLLKVIASFGTAPLAAFGIALRAFSLNWIPYSGLNAAVATLVGQQLGARDQGSAWRVVERGLALGTALGFAFCVAYVAWAEELIALFDASPAVVLAGVPFLQLIAVGILFNGPALPMSAAMNGAGDTRPPMIAAFLANWPLKLPLAWALAIPFGLGVAGVWWGMFVSILAEAIALWFWFRRGRWTQTSV